MKQLSIAGRLGRDAELRHTQSGVATCRFSVAIDSRKGAEKVTTWISCTIFGKRGEALCQHLKNGTTVAAVGDLEVRTYEKNGETKVDVGMVVSEITLLGGGQRSPESRSGGSYDRASPGGYADGEFAGDAPF